MGRRACCTAAARRLAVLSIPSQRQGETRQGLRKRRKEGERACMHELKLVWLKCNILKVWWVTLKHNNLNHNVCPLKYTLADWVSCSSKCS